MMAFVIILLPYSYKIFPKVAFVYVHQTPNCAKPVKAIKHIGTIALFIIIQACYFGLWCLVGCFGLYWHFVTQHRICHGYRH